MSSNFACCSGRLVPKRDRPNRDFGGDHAAEIGRQRGVVIARNPDPVAPYLQRRQRIAVRFGQPLMGGAVMKTVAERDHHARVVPRDDSREATECRHRIVRRQQHAARRETGAFFQMQIRDHEQALLFPEQGAGEIGDQGHARDIQRRSSNGIDCSSRHGFTKKKDVDARHKAGHDGVDMSERNRSILF